MKPLLLIKIEDNLERQQHAEIAKGFEHLANDYDIIVYDRLDIRVYYFWINPITYLFNKLKVWLILRTQKNK